MGYITTQVYDGVGQQLAVVDANANRTTFHYDPVGQRTLQLDPLARRTTFSYDADDRQVTRSDARGLTTTYVYDADDLRTVTRYATDQAVTFTYDANGNRLTLVDSTGSTAYAYDLLDRRAGVTKVLRRVGYGFDAVGQRVTMTYTGSGTFSYTYDGAGRLSNLVNPQSECTTFSYDAADRRTAQTQATGVVSSYTYDKADRLTGLLSVTQAGVTHTSFDYRYDNAANRVGVTEVDGTRTTWTYDKTYQLTGEVRTNAVALDWTSFTLAEWQAFSEVEWQRFKLDAGTGTYDTTYTYDPAGNRLLKSDSGTLTTFSYDAANQLKTSVDAGGVTTFTYDPAGNLQLQQAPSGVTTNTWDNENRRTRVTLPSGQRNTFSYNGDGLRFQKQDSAGTTRFVWDGDAYLAETSGANATQVEYTQEPGGYGGLISQRRLSGGIWTPSYYLLDGLGSTVGLTDTSATLTDLYLYKAFGETISSAGATRNPFRWVGQVGYYFDADLLEYYLRARTYDPALARFLSLDPLNFDGGDWNCYRYITNNPINLKDPSGMMHPALAGCLAGAIGAALAQSWYDYWTCGWNWKKAACAAVGGCAQGAIIGLVPGFPAGCLGGAVNTILTELCKASLGERGPLNACDAFNILTNVGGGCAAGTAAGADNAMVSAIMFVFGFTQTVSSEVCGVVM